MHAGAGARRNRYPSGHEGDAALASFSPAASTLAIYLIGVYTGPAASWQTLGRPWMTTTKPDAVSLACDREPREH